MNAKNLNPTLAQWVERVNPFVAYYAITQAHQAICLHELASYVQSKQLEPYLKGQVKANWKKLGKSHLQVMAPLVEALAQHPIPEADDLRLDAQMYLQAKYELRPGGEVWQQIHDRLAAGAENWATAGM